MRKMFAAMTAAALVLALGAPAFAKTETVQGQVVDLGCYKMDKANNAGVDHKMPKGDTKDCAIGCAKAGKPMAILTKDGKVYQLAGGVADNNNAKIIPHVGQTVQVTGDVMDHDGTLMIMADSLKAVGK